MTSTRSERGSFVVGAVDGVVQRPLRPLALGLVPLFVTTIAGSQQAGTGRRLCVDAETLPACRSFIVTEAHVLARLGPDAGSGACCPEILYTAYLTAELAWMVNLRGGRSAVGIGVFGGREFAIEGTQIGVRGRYRRWLNQRRAVEAGAGMVFTSASPGGLTQHRGLTTQVSLDLGSWIEVAGGVDWVPGLEFDRVRVSPSLYLGFSLSRTPARVVWAATGAGGLLAAAFKP